MDADSDLAAVHRMKKWLRIVLLVVAFLGHLSRGVGESRLSAHPPMAGQTRSGCGRLCVVFGVDGSPITNRMDVGPGEHRHRDRFNRVLNYSFYVVAYDLNQNEERSFQSIALQHGPQPYRRLQLTQISDGTMAITFSVAPGAPCHGGIHRYA